MKINYDAELLERARWIVEHGVDKPAKHEIERRPFLELPLPIYRKGEKHEMDDEARRAMFGHLIEKDQFHVGYHLED
jgi:hypothetical protein